MSEPSETSGRPLATPIQEPQQPEGNSINPSSSPRTKHLKSSLPSDDSSEGSKPTVSRRRPGNITKASTGPHTGSSRSAQRSAASPTSMTSHMSSVHYTRTGRISKAKKGLKVHNCEHCGRSYTRAEHLRRHQKNHAQEDALVCEFPDCGKSFYRLDLLHRHQERHNETGKDSRQGSVSSQEGSPPAPPVSMPMPVATSVGVATLLPTSYLSQHPVSHIHETPALPRYTYHPFRTPQVPRTPNLPSSGFSQIPRSSPTSSPNHKPQGSYPHRQSIAAPVLVDGMSNVMGWSEAYSQSPPYSSSSGYASPIPDYANVFANPPYGHGDNRTRASSTASFTEPWSYTTPRSPVSSTSTMPYTWASTDKAPTVPCLAYMGTSYPMSTVGMTTSVEAMSGYGYEPKTMGQRDEEEGIMLFPDQPYGMGQIAHTYPFEQYLNNYWRLFHPTFPVVHRPTFESVNPSPMLHAAMIAVGGQYSSEMSTKRKSRILHDRCIKLLERRDQEPMAEPDRICDYQAVFLIEVLSQYRARRAAKILSPRFGTLYHKASEHSRHTTSQLADIVRSLSRLENVTIDSWIRWIDLSAWQRLLASCYVLESQQAMLLAREPLPSLFQQSGIDLPFPAHTLLWDATTLSDWAIAAQHSSHSPQYVYEVIQDSLITPCDTFQSSILVATNYNRFNSITPYVNASSVSDIDHFLDGSFATKLKLLTAKLVQVTPIRALLSVAGVSWILSEKVSSPQAFAQLKTTLRIWINQLWSSSTADAQPVPVKEALRLSIDILQLTLNERPDALALEMGTDMGPYFASLVLWAMTVAASTHAKPTQQVALQAPRRQQSQPSSLSYQHIDIGVPVPATPAQLSQSFSSQPSMTASPAHTSIPGLVHSQPTSPARHDSLAATTLLSHEQITVNSISFLADAHALAASDPASQSALNISCYQAGCISLLLWVKLQLRGAPIEDQSGMGVWASRPGEGLGELLDSVVGSLERVLNRGWTGWGI